LLLDFDDGFDLFDSVAAVPAEVLLTCVFLSRLSNPPLLLSSSLVLFSVLRVELFTFYGLIIRNSTSTSRLQYSGGTSSEFCAGG